MTLNLIGLSPVGNRYIFNINSGDHLLSHIKISDYYFFVFKCLSVVSRLYLHFSFLFIIYNKELAICTKLKKLQFNKSTEKTIAFNRKHF